jgi:hypothetical protein
MSGAFGATSSISDVVRIVDALQQMLKLQGATYELLKGGMMISVGVTGAPDWTSGVGAPVAVKPIGSLYSDTAGAIGSTLFVSRGGGTWLPVAGV